MLDRSFCWRYGFDDYSAHALQYLDDWRNRPSLAGFLAEAEFIVGNFLFRSAEPVEIGFETDDVLRWVSVVRFPERKRPYFGFLGLVVRPDRLRLDALGAHDCAPEDHDALESRYYWQVYCCRRCGALHVCSCSHPAKDPDGMYARARGEIGDITLLAGLCLGCTEIGPPLRPFTFNGDSLFMNYYRPHAGLLGDVAVMRNIGWDVEGREAALRELFGFPPIGDTGIGEELLYRCAAGIFGAEHVQRRYRGREWEGLELDIWVPSVGLGIEYQGVQHFRRVALWHGEKGFARTQANDARKRALCAQLGYKLVHHHHDEPISRVGLLQRLRRDWIV